jgi:RNA polymerase sigma-70 factor (ECF subfamily)
MGTVSDPFSALLDRLRGTLAGAGQSALTAGYGIALRPAGVAISIDGHSVIQAQDEPDKTRRRRHESRRLSAPAAPSPGADPGSGDEKAVRALAERARSDDPNAFTELFALHREKIHRLCRRMLDDVSLADDATSEVYLRARRSFPTYDSDERFHPWLRALASNYCIDQLRRRKTERSLFSEADLSTDDLADDTPGALTRITRREERGEVLEALDRLPDKFRLPLVLRFYRNLDYDGIAEILGVTRGQVGTLLFRGKKRLRQELVMAESESRPSSGSDDPRSVPTPQRRRPSSGKDLS